ncbi:hypothetical protein EG329_003171 [Mollisiaceae sp. DMI_Dod_QoI]|nr:hypothetical protein EG329_003171 [Helotiales sp. DMI_Dod_QoI]
MDRWVFELLGSIISVACFAGIVVTLMVHENHPLPSWPFGITINALISTLSTISKSALLATVAAAISQRKWARFSNGANPLSDLEIDMVSLGAVITLLTLAVDPFTQQILSFENAPHPIGSSNISARIIFETGVYPDGGVMQTENANGFVQTSGSFTSLVNQGLYFDGNLSNTFSRNALELRPQSSGGNVTFGVVETLAVCSECANITTYLPPPEKCDASHWNWTLPNKASTGCTLFGDRSTNVITLISNANPLVLDTTGHLVILNLTAIVPGWFSSDPASPDGVALPGAAQECSLYWCVNRYESSLSGGLLTETLMSSHANGSTQSGSSGFPFFALKPPGSNSSFSQPNSTAYGNYSTDWINGTFLINTESHLLIQSYLEDLLSGYATSIEIYSPGNAISSNPSVLRIYSKTSWDKSTNGTYFDMQGIFDAIALGMTTQLRQADPTRNPTDGLLRIEDTETAMQVVIRVSWAWIALPALLQVATLGFLWHTLVRTRKLPTWKSSALAVLFFGMRIRKAVESNEVEKVSDMMHVAGNYYPSIHNG